MIFLKAVYLLFKLYFYDLVGMVWNNSWASNAKEKINKHVYNYAFKISAYDDDKFHQKFIIPMFRVLIGIIMLELLILNKLLARDNLYITLELSKLLFFMVYALMWGTISKKELKRRFFDFGRMSLWTALILLAVTFVLYFFIASFLSYYYNLKVTPTDFVKSNAISTILYSVSIAFLILLIAFAAIPYIVSKIIVGIFRGIIKITIDKYPTDPLKPISTFISILFSIEMFVTIISILRK
jgi:hypothetical protein